MALWLCRAGRHGEHEQKFLDEGRVYLTWRGLDRDLGQLTDLKSVRQLLEEKYPKYTQGHLTQNSGQLFAFAERMSPGDWVAVPSKRKTIHIGEITGDYTFVPEGPDPYFHFRQVNWLETDIPRTNFDQDILNSLGAFMSMFRGCKYREMNLSTRSSLRPSDHCQYHGRR